MQKPVGGKMKYHRNKTQQQQGATLLGLLGLPGPLFQLPALDSDQEVAGLEEPVDEDGHTIEQHRGREGERDEHALAVKVLLL